MTTTKFPMSTGQAAHLLGTTEPRLAETVRRGKIKPKPSVLAGRRLWQATHILQAATTLKLLTDELRATLREAASQTRKSQDNDEQGGKQNATT